MPDGPEGAKNGSGAEAGLRQAAASVPDTLESLNNLAMLIQDQGKLDEAELLCREALEGRRAQLGVSHPNTGGS